MIVHYTVHLYTQKYNIIQCDRTHTNNILHVVGTTRCARVSKQIQRYSAAAVLHSWRRQNVFETKLPQICTDRAELAS